MSGFVTFLCPTEAHVQIYASTELLLSCIQIYFPIMLWSRIAQLLFI